MTPDILDLLDRSVSRAREEHVSVLLTVLNEAVSVINPTRRATVQESLKLLEEESLRARKDYFSHVRQAVLSVIEGTNAAFTSEDKSTVLALVGKYVESSLYLNRFTAYEDAVARHVAGFGSPFQLSDFRVDLTKASYEVGAINSIRNFLNALGDDLEIVAQKQRNSSASVSTKQEDKLEQANRLIKLEPNLFGIGINVNYLIRWLRGKRE